MLRGIDLVHIGNMALIREVEGSALLELPPFRSTPRPPVIAAPVAPGESEAKVYLTDIYHGPGLAGMSRGTVKRLRIFSYHSAFVKTGGRNSGWL